MDPKKYEDLNKFDYSPFKPFQSVALDGLTGGVSELWNGSTTNFLKQLKIEKYTNMLPGPWAKIAGSATSVVLGMSLNEVGENMSSKKDQSWSDFGFDLGVSVAGTLGALAFPLTVPGLVGSTLLGGVIGGFVSMGRSIYKEHKKFMEYPFGQYFNDSDSGLAEDDSSSADRWSNNQSSNPANHAADNSMNTNNEFDTYIDFFDSKFLGYEGDSETHSEDGSARVGMDPGTQYEASDRSNDAHNDMENNSTTSGESGHSRDQIANEKSDASNTYRQGRNTWHDTDSAALQSDGIEDDGTHLHVAQERDENGNPTGRYREYITDEDGMVIDEHPVYSDSDSDGDGSPDNFDVIDDSTDESTDSKVDDNHGRNDSSNSGNDEEDDDLDSNDDGHSEQSDDLGSDNNCSDECNDEIPNPVKDDSGDQKSRFKDIITGSDSEINWGPDGKAKGGSSPFSDRLSSVDANINWGPDGNQKTANSKLIDALTNLGPNINWGPDGEPGARNGEYSIFNPAIKGLAGINPRAVLMDAGVCLMQKNASELVGDNSDSFRLLATQDLI